MSKIVGPDGKPTNSQVTKATVANLNVVVSMLRQQLNHLQQTVQLHLSFYEACLRKSFEASGADFDAFLKEWQDSLVEKKEGDEQD